MVSSKPPAVYVDASVFLNVVYQEAGKWPEALKVLNAFERGDITMVASTMVHSELCGWSGKNDDNPAVQRLLQGYLDRPELRVIEIDTLLVRDARALAAKHHLHGCDAVHLAGALRLEADYLFTRDDRLLRVGNTEGGLSVTHPTVVWTPTMDDAKADHDAGS